MIAKVVLICALVAAAHASVLLNSGIVAPGYLGAGILAPKYAVPIAPLAVSRTIVSPGLIGAAPLAYGSGIVTGYGGIGLKGVGMYGAPGLIKTIY